MNSARQKIVRIKPRTFEGYCRHKAAQRRAEDDACNVCGCIRHSLPVYLRGWAAYTLLMALPLDKLPSWLWMWLVAYSADYSYDQRSYCDAHHGTGQSEPARDAKWILAGLALGLVAAGVLIADKFGLFTQ